MFVERLSSLPGTLPDFQPASPATDRVAWQRLPAEVRRALVAEGDAAVAAGDYPDLPPELYRDYSLTGNRQRFEARYFDRRRKLNAVVLAECAGYQGRFLEHIVRGVMLMCEEAGWQLPAHNAQERGGRRDPLPDPDRPIVDLFAAETGAQLAVIAFLIGPQLERVAPGIVARLDLEIERRIIRPYLERGFWWMGREGDGPTNNWTAWCTQNVLLVAFCRPLDAARRRGVVDRACASLDAFLGGYGEDGACAEGPLYYRHAALCLFTSLTVLDRVAPGAFAPLWREPKLRNIAEYIVTTHVAGRHFINFGDCSAVLEGCGAREFLFGQAVCSKPLADFAAADWQSDRRVTLPDEISTFTRVQHAFAVQQLLAHKSEPVQRTSVHLQSIGLFIARDDRFTVAVQAGNNGDGHGHNDVGNLIAYKNGRPLLIDVGVESYSAKTFSADRYDIWTMQSAWHNLPSFEGIMQRHGEAYGARNVETVFTSDRAEIAMDIAPAYPEEAGLEYYRRRVRLSCREAIDLWDCYEGERSAELSLLLVDEPILDNGRIRLGERALLVLEGAGSALRIERIPITDPRLLIAWPNHIFRVLVPLERKQFHLRII